MWYRNLLNVFILFCFNFLCAQNIVVQDYTLNKNLNTNEILKIFKDSRQFFWVSTRNGLFIKDMEVFRKMSYFNDKNFSNINDIIEDKDHNMWFASYGDGVIYFNGKEIKQFNVTSGLLSDRNSKLLEDENNIYVGGFKGVSIINKRTHKISKASFNYTNISLIEVNNLFKIGNKIFVTTSYNGVYELVDNKLKLFKTISNIVTAYVYKSDVVITSNEGVFVYKISDFLSDKTYNKKINIPIIWDYALIGDNKYWMLTSDLVNSKGVIYEYDDRRDTNTKVISEINLDLEYPRGIVFDKNNNVVYISSQDSGLKRILLNMPHEYFPMNNQGVTDILSIDDHQYFITKNDFYIQKNNKIVAKTSLNDFYNFFQKNKLAYKNYFESNPEFFKINYNQEKSNIKFYHLKFHNNYFWIGSNIGLFKLNNLGKIINMYPIHTYNFEFSGNSLIDAHPFRGIKVFNDLDSFRYKYYNNDTPSIPSFVVSMDKIDDKVFFASSIYGLYKYENGNFYSYLVGGEFKESKIKLIKCISNNRILLATELGDVYVLEVDQNKLNILRHIKKTEINSENILMLNEINGKIVIGTYNNLIILDDKKIFYYDKLQGFIFDKMNKSAIWDNKLIVGVDKGYYVVDIDKIADYKPTKNKLIVTNLKINNENLPAENFQWFNLINKNLVLSSSENNIYIDFNLVNTKYPEKYKFRYRLNPELEWSEYFTENSIHLNSLNYGKYKVELEVNDINGNRSEVFSLVELKINAPFYLHPLFIFFCVLVTSLILFIFYDQKIRNIKDINVINIQKIESENESHRQQIILEKKISEVRLMALQSQMNPHFIFNILNSIQYYIINQDVENALETLNKFARLIRKMLDLSREQFIPLITKIDFLKLYVEIENSRYLNKVKFIVNVDQDINIHQTMVPPMMIQPLIENAFVHGFDSNKEDNILTLDISQEAEYYIFKVIDNGKGLKNDFSSENHKSKGLNIIKERLSIFNDNNEKDFLIFENNNPGTVVTLYLKKDYKVLSKFHS